MCLNLYKRLIFSPDPEGKGYLSIYLLFHTYSLQAQVSSYLYSEQSKAFGFYPQLEVSLQVPAPSFQMPSFDAEKLISQDEAIKDT
jgi:hypothetical protein